MKKLHYHVAPLHNLTKLDKPHHFIGSVSLLVMGILFYSAMITQLAMAATAPGENLPIIIRPSSYTLSVTKSGSGTITSVPTGINCGSTCAVSYVSNSTVTLTATAASGSIFNGWGGSCTGTTSTCVLSLNANKAVTANFAPIPLELPYVTTNAATSITSNSATLSASVNPNGVSTSVVFRYGSTQSTSCSNLSQVSESSVFTGSSPISVSRIITGLLPSTTYYYCAIANSSVGNSVSVVKSFITTTNVVINNYILTVTKNGTEADLVTSSPTGINCGSSCSASFVAESVVTLTAKVGTGSSFVSWVGCNSVTGLTCNVSISANKSIIANFAPLPISTKLSVVLDATSPLASNINAGGTNVPFTTIKFSAIGGDVSINTVQVNSDALNASALSNISVYYGTMLLGSSSTLNFTDPSYKWTSISIAPQTVKKDSTMALRLVADIGFNASGSYRLGLVGLGYNSEHAPTSVNVVFPLYGNLMTVPATATATLSVALDASSPAAANIPSSQTGVAFTRIKLSATGGNITLSNLQINSDSANLSALSNIKIFDDSTLIGSAASLNLSNPTHGWFYADIITPVNLANNTSKILTIKADLSGQASGVYRLGMSGIGFSGSQPNTGVTFPLWGNMMSVQGSNLGIVAGDVIKGAGEPPLYYFDGTKRLVFPNVETYFSWYKDFSNVKTVAISTLTSLPIGKNITIRPGTKLVQKMSDSGFVNVYAVSYPNILHKIPEAKLSTMYPNWQNSIIKIPDVLWLSYSIGAPIVDKYPDNTLLNYSGSYYLIYNKEIHRLTTSALLANWYNTNNAVTPSLFNMSDYNLGSDIVSVMPCLTDVAQWSVCSFSGPILSLPDLAISNFKVGPSIVPNNMYKYVEFDISNLGQGEVLSDFRIVVTNLTNNEIILDKIQQGTYLRPNGKYSPHMLAFLDQHFVVGTNNIQIVVDADKVVSESNEDNNAYTKNIVIGNESMIKYIHGTRTIDAKRLSRFKVDYSSPNANAIIYKTFNAGDGTPTHTNVGSAYFVHPYTKPGTYKAVFTVAEKNGASSQEAIDVVVRDPLFCQNPESIVRSPLQTNEFADLGLDSSKHPEIKSYRIKLPAGNWSIWYTPGVNDMDSIRNPDGSPRLRWAYFANHTHEIKKCVGSQDSYAPIFKGLEKIEPLKPVNNTKSAYFSWLPGVGLDSYKKVSASTPLTYKIYEATKPGGFDFTRPIWSTTVVPYFASSSLNYQSFATKALRYLIKRPALPTPTYYIVRASDPIGNQDKNFIQRAWSTIISVITNK